MRIILALGLLTALAGCAGRNVHVPSTPEVNAIEPGYLDLRAGWRLVVVAPILNSGGYRLPSLQEKGNEDLGHLSAGPDFVGYETDTYAVAKSGNGVQLQFRSAEIVKDGKKSRQTAPRLRLFELASTVPYVRLIYLVRASQADHNMALVAAEDSDSLVTATRLLQTNPGDGCKDGPHGSCSWIPAGIAVRPEERRAVDGVTQWVAVQ